MTIVNPHGDQIHDLLISLGIFTFAALPGYIIAVFGMDAWGRKTIQLWGFAMMTASFAGIALIGKADAMLYAFIGLYGMNYFFTEFGPNTTTFVLPAEIFPAKVRTTSHGLAATVGKIGAALGTFGFPLLQARFGLAGPMWVAAATCLIGLAVTQTLPTRTERFRVGGSLARYGSYPAFCICCLVESMSRKYPSEVAPSEGNKSTAHRKCDDEQQGKNCHSIWCAPKYSVRP